MASQRSERIGRQILQEIALIVRRDVADPRLELVTFTSVRMTPDLRNARVFFSCIGDEREARRCMQGLTQASGMLRREIGRRLPLRHVPSLHFEYDDSAQRAERITRLLHDGEISQEDTPDGDAGRDRDD